MNLHENIQRIKQMMGLIVESTDKITTKNDEIILVSDWVKNHIKEHNQFGAFEIEVPKIGFDLVKPYDEAMSYDNNEESTTIKKEGNNEIEVPLIKTSETADKFSTDRLTLIIRKSNPNFLPDDVKEDTELLDKINQGKVYSLLTAFPGNPDIPKASEWNGRFAVIVPKKESKINLNKDNETMK